MLLVKHFKECKKNFNILANGILTKGKVISKTPTGTKINKKPVYEVIFEFTDKNKNTIRSSVNSYKPEKLVDESEEPIVYLPSSPDKAIMLDALPGSVRRFFDNY